MKNFGIKWCFILFVFFVLWKVSYGFKGTLEIMKEEHGVIGEAHNVTTEDGYILTLHRINGGFNSTPVLIVGGLTTNSAGFLFLGRNHSLPYLLADQGYDVWLSNVRGNNYAVSHVNLTTSDEEFWNFSYHEMGYYDTPAMIKYISTLSKKKIIFIGHSQGTQVGFVMASMRHDAAKNVSLMIHFAPIGFLYKTKGLLHLLRYPFFFFTSLMRPFMNVNLFSAPKPFFYSLRKMISIFCPFVSFICETITFLIVGIDYPQFLPNPWTIFMRGAFTGSSMKNFLHYHQAASNEVFTQFDYGKEKNMQIYHQSSAPAYNLTQITVPTYFICSRTDWLSLFHYAKRLYKSLSNPAGFHIIKYTKFTHADYIWAKDAKKLLYDHTIDVMNSYRDISLS